MIIGNKNYNVNEIKEHILTTILFIVGTLLAYFFIPIGWYDGCGTAIFCVLLVIAIAIHWGIYAEVFWELSYLYTTLCLIFGCHKLGSFYHWPKCIVPVIICSLIGLFIIIKLYCWDAEETINKINDWKIAKYNKKCYVLEQDED